MAARERCQPCGEIIKCVTVMTLTLAACASPTLRVSAAGEQVSLEQLSEHPEAYDGRRVILHAFGYRVFEGMKFERIQLWGKDVDGRCETVRDKSFSIAIGEIHKSGDTKRMPRSSAHYAQLFSFSGVFHDKDVDVNPGLLNFHWDASMDKVAVTRLEGTCIVR